MPKKNKEYFIIVKEINEKIKVSTKTYYKIFNNEIGSLTAEGYAISLETLKKYKKLYNGLRRS